jgi:MFS family permease
MFRLEIISDGSVSEIYYYSLIIFLLFILVVLKFISEMLISSEKSKETDLDSTLLNKINNSQEFIEIKKSLRFRYLFCYVITKANIWSKTPYLWALYNMYHGFTVKEIGILYLVDNFSAMISGPITGGLSDIFGRKFFCMSYCVIVIINLGLRLTGVRSLAYIAQVLTGTSAALINTTFESWVNFEATKVFKDSLLQKEQFLKKLFKLQTLFDAIMSVVASMIAALFYLNYGIKAPIIMAIILAFIGMICIFFMWDENKPNKMSKMTK